MKKVLIGVTVCLALSMALPCYGWCRWCYGPRGWYHPNGIWLADGITGIVANGLGMVNSLYGPGPVVYPGGSIIVQRPLYRYPVYERQWYAPPPPPPPLY